MDDRRLDVVGRDRKVCCHAVERATLGAPGQLRQLASGAGLLGMSRGRRSHPILRMRHAASASAEIYLPLCGVGVSTAHSIA
jgi:hypothetical protein